MNLIGFVPLFLWAVAFVGLVGLVSYSSLATTRGRVVMYYKTLKQHEAELLAALLQLVQLLQQNHAALSAKSKSIVEAWPSVKDDAAYTQALKQVTDLYSKLPEGEVDATVTELEYALRLCIAAVKPYRSSLRTYKEFVRRKPSSYFAAVFRFRLEPI